MPSRCTSLLDRTCVGEHLTLMGRCVAPEVRTDKIMLRQKDGLVGPDGRPITLGGGAVVKLQLKENAYVGQYGQDDFLKIWGESAPDVQIGALIYHDGGIDDFTFIASWLRNDGGTLTDVDAYVPNEDAGRQYGYIRLSKNIIATSVDPIETTDDVWQGVVASGLQGPKGADGAPGTPGASELLAELKVLSYDNGTQVVQIENWEAVVVGAHVWHEWLPDFTYIKWLKSGTGGAPADNDAYIKISKGTIFQNLKNGDVLYQGVTSSTSVPGGDGVFETLLVTGRVGGNNADQFDLEVKNGAETSITKLDNLMVVKTTTSETVNATASTAVNLTATKATCTTMDADASTIKNTLTAPVIFCNDRLEGDALDRRLRIANVNQLDADFISAFYSVYAGKGELELKDPTWLAQTYNVTQKGTVTGPMDFYFPLAEISSNDSVILDDAYWKDQGFFNQKLPLTMKALRKIANDEERNEVDKHETFYVACQQDRLDPEYAVEKEKLNNGSEIVRMQFLHREGGPKLPFNTGLGGPGSCTPWLMHEDFDHPKKPVLVEYIEDVTYENIRYTKIKATFNKTAISLIEQQWSDAEVTAINAIRGSSRPEKQQLVAFCHDGTADTAPVSGGFLIFDKRVLDTLETSDKLQQLDMSVTPTLVQFSTEIDNHRLSITEADTTDKPLTQVRLQIKAPVDTTLDARVGLHVRTDVQDTAAMKSAHYGSIKTAVGFSARTLFDTPADGDFVIGMGMQEPTVVKPRGALLESTGRLRLSDGNSKTVNLKDGFMELVTENPDRTVRAEDGTLKLTQGTNEVLLDAQDASLTLTSGTKTLKLDPSTALGGPGLDLGDHITVSKPDGRMTYLNPADDRHWHIVDHEQSRLKKEDAEASLQVMFDWNTVPGGSPDYTGPGLFLDRGARAIHTHAGSEWYAEPGVPGQWCRIKPDNIQLYDERTGDSCTISAKTHILALNDWVKLDDEKHQVTYLDTAEPYASDSIPYAAGVEMQVWHLGNRVHRGDDEEAYLTVDEVKVRAGTDVASLTPTALTLTDADGDTLTLTAKTVLGGGGTDLGPNIAVDGDAMRWTDDPSTCTVRAREIKLEDTTARHLLELAQHADGPRLQLGDQGSMVLATLSQDELVYFNGAGNMLEYKNDGTVKKTSFGAETTIDLFALGGGTDLGDHIAVDGDAMRWTALPDEGKEYTTVTPTLTTRRASRVVYGDNNVYLQACDATARLLKLHTKILQDGVEVDPTTVSGAVPMRTCTLNEQGLQVEFKVADLGFERNVLDLRMLDHGPELQLGSANTKTALSRTKLEFADAGVSVEYKKDGTVHKTTYQGTTTVDLFDRAPSFGTWGLFEDSGKQTVSQLDWEGKKRMGPQFTLISENKADYMAYMPDHFTFDQSSESFAFLHPHHFSMQYNPSQVKYAMDAAAADGVDVPPPPPTHNSLMQIKLHTPDTEDEYYQFSTLYVNNTKQKYGNVHLDYSGLRMGTSWKSPPGVGDSVFLKPYGFEYWEKAHSTQTPKYDIRWDEVAALVQGGDAQTELEFEEGIHSAKLTSSQLTLLGDQTQTILTSEKLELGPGGGDRMQLMPAGLNVMKPDSNPLYYQLCSVMGDKIELYSSDGRVDPHLSIQSEQLTAAGIQSINALRSGTVDLVGGSNTVHLTAKNDDEQKQAEMVVSGQHSGHTNTVRIASRDAQQNTSPVLSLTSTYSTAETYLTDGSIGTTGLIYAGPADNPTAAIMGLTGNAVFNKVTSNGAFAIDDAAFGIVEVDHTALSSLKKVVTHGLEAPILLTARTRIETLETQVSTLQGTVATLLARLDALTGKVTPFAVQGYYPLYHSSHDAAQASPSLTYHAHYLNGAYYYMPDATNLHHGTYV